MISQLFGRLVVREIDHVEIMTEGGVGYELSIPLSAYEALPKVGEAATLQSVPRVGRKKTEQLVLDLADKFDEIGGAPSGGGLRPDGAGADDAIRALVSLGYTLVEAEKAVRAALDANGRAQSATELIRNALAKVRG